jgi:hypothetical protein
MGDKNAIIDVVHICVQVPRKDLHIKLNMIILTNQYPNAAVWVVDLFFQLSVVAFT